MLCSVKVVDDGRSVGWYISRIIILLILLYKYINRDLTITFFDVVIITVCIGSVALAIYDSGRKNN